jgi:GR25 family glycosyltransferase involved in LPS biosynthesis
MTSGLPPIYLINLDRSTERRRRFRELNGHLTDVTRVPGMDGSTLIREALEKSGYITCDLSYGAGALGCALSHVRLWETAAAQNRPMTIFEDAVAVSYRFEKTAADLLASLPVDWDVVLWGYSLNPLYVWVDLGISKARLHVYGPTRYGDANGIQKFQNEQFHGGLFRLLHAFGTFGYSISASGARTALEYCRPLRDRWITFPDAGVRTRDVGIDVALCGLYPSLRAFICVPPLIVRCQDQASVRKEINKERQRADTLV